MPSNIASSLSRVANWDGIGGLAGCVPQSVLDVIFLASDKVADVDIKADWDSRSAFVRRAQLLAFNSALDIWRGRRAALKTLEFIHR